jgi:hypothetical protein
MDGRIALAWSSRPQPLIARAVAATGDAAVALGKRLMALDEAALARLTAVAADGVLIVLGDADALPWVDGVEYLGRDVSAPDLLLPTARAPTVPAPALQHAVVARPAATRGAAPYAMWRSDGVLRLVPCGPARAIERTRLATWLARTGSAADAEIAGGALAKGAT